jgi:hypothetical protein
MKKRGRSDASYFYSDDYTSNGFGANAPKKGIALLLFVTNNQKLKGASLRHLLAQ